MGVWSNFAIHPTSFGGGNLLFSGDNAGIAERVAVDAITGSSSVPADRPFVNVWTNGNEGDISPNGGPDRPATSPCSTRARAASAARTSPAGAWPTASSAPGARRATR